MKPQRHWRLGGRGLWRLWLGIGGVVVASLLVGVIAAGARPSANAAITFPKANGHPTGVYEIRGGGFGAKDTVSFTFDKASVGSTTATSSGSFATTFTVPGTATPGVHTLTATGSPSGRVAAASFVVRTNWEQFHFSDSHKGVNPYENVLGTSNVAGLKLAWATQTGAAVGLGSPVVFDGFVYIANSAGKLLALRESDGVVVWSATTGAEIRSAPTIYHDHVYVTTGEGSSGNQTFCFRLRDGQLLWTAAAGNSSASPTPEDGIVYVGGGPLTALNADTGATIWSYTAGDEFHGSPSVEHGLVTAGSVDYHTYALNARTGTLVWSARPSDGGQDSDEVFGATAQADGRVFVADIIGRVFALDEKTGATLWAAPMGSGDAFSSPTVVNNLVIAGASDGSLYAFNTKTGKHVWTAATTAGSNLTAAAAANGVVYVGSSDGNIYGFNAATGAKLWHAPTAGPVNSSPAVTNGTMFIGSGDGKIYAFRTT